MGAVEDFATPGRTSGPGRQIGPCFSRPPTLVRVFFILVSRIEFYLDKTRWVQHRVIPAWLGEFFRFRPVHRRNMSAIRRLLSVWSMLGTRLVPGRESLRIEDSDMLTAGGQNSRVPHIRETLVDRLSTATKRRRQTILRKWHKQTCP